MRLTKTLFTPIPDGVEIKTDSLKMWKTLDELCDSMPADCQNFYNEPDSAGFVVSRQYRLTHKGMNAFRQKHRKWFS